VIQILAGKAKQIAKREVDEVSPEEVGSRQGIAKREVDEVSPEENWQSTRESQRESRGKSEVDEVSPEAGSQRQNARRKTSEANAGCQGDERRPARRLAVDVEVDE